MEDARSIANPAAPTRYAGRMVDIPMPDATPATNGIRVGIGGWNFAPWRGLFYPAGLVQRRELEYASRHLSAIEINGTYYGTQKPETYAKWRDEVPEGFVFSAKAPRRIMQARDLGKTATQVEDFIAGIAVLGDRLGPLLWQFDAGQRPARDALEAFVAALPRTADGRHLRHVIDVRDPSLVDAEHIAMLRRHDVAGVCTDSGEFPRYADVTSDFVYARPMRSRAGIATGYPAAELAAWAARARAWAAGGEPDDLARLAGPAPASDRRDVFVFFIAAAKERNPAAAMKLIDLLAAH